MPVFLSYILTCVKGINPNRFVRWSRRGVFERILAALAGEAEVPRRLMIDATHLKAHRTAASLRQKGLFRAASGAPKAG